MCAPLHIEKNCPSNLEKWPKKIDFGLTNGLPNFRPYFVHCRPILARLLHWWCLLWWWVKTGWACSLGGGRSLMDSDSFQVCVVYSFKLLHHRDICKTRYPSVTNIQTTSVILGVTVYEVLWTYVYVYIVHTCNVCGMVLQKVGSDMNGFLKSCVLNC